MCSVSIFFQSYAQWSMEIMLNFVLSVEFCKWLWQFENLDLFPPKHLVLIVKPYFENLGVEETKINVTLNCPISKRRITVPARGDDCDHIQVQMMKIYQSLQVVLIYASFALLFNSIELNVMIACVGDGIFGGRGLYSGRGNTKVETREGSMQKTVCSVLI